jgi:hypothetical protein
MVGEKREEKRKRNLSVFSTSRENVGTQGKLYLIFPHGLNGLAR